jgi:outer membrane protein assembly factor BamD
VIARRKAVLVLALLAAACAKKPPTFEEVEPADVLYQRGTTMLEEGKPILGFIPRVDYDDAIELFQSIIDNYPYSEYAVLAELRIADAYFDDEKYEEALAYYRDFADLHPQHEMVPYTIYRAALCHERRMRSPDRDQTPTRDALVFLDRLLAHYPYSEYAGEAEVLWRSLRTQLADHVKRIGDFYLARDEWESAAERYRTLLNEYPGLGLDAEALYRLGICYLHMNRKTEAEGIFQAIVQNYRDSDVARDAEKRIESLHEG